MYIIFKKEGFIIMKTPKLRRYVVDLLIPEDTPISKNIPTDNETEFNVINVYAKDVAYYNNEDECFDLVPTGYYMRPNDVMYSNPYLGFVEDNTSLYPALKQLPGGVPVDECGCDNDSCDACMSVAPYENKPMDMSNLSKDDIINTIESLRENINNYTRKVNMALDYLSDTIIHK